MDKFRRELEKAEKKYDRLNLDGLLNEREKVYDEIKAIGAVRAKIDQKLYLLLKSDDAHPILENNLYHKRSVIRSNERLLIKKYAMVNEIIDEYFNCESNVDVNSSIGCVKYYGKDGQTIEKTEPIEKYFSKNELGK